MCFKAEKMISTLPPLPPHPKSTNLDQRLGKKMTHFSLTEKRKRRKEGGKEKRKKGKKEGRKERKEAKKGM